MSRPRQPPGADHETETFTESGLHSRSVPATEGYLRAAPFTPSSGSNRRSSYSTPYQGNALSLSPAVGNYFGLQRHRESNRPNSSTIEEQSERNEEGRDDLDFWGRPRSARKSGFFGGRLNLAATDTDEEDDDEYDDDDEDEEADGVFAEEDDFDEEDSIDIFGHR